MKVSTSKINPDPKFKSELYNHATNTRTMTTFTWAKPIGNSKEEYDIGFARNKIPKNQCRIPMKMLVPDQSNTYLCQKSPLVDRSQDIRNAGKIIEPLNVGFWDYIRCIPINQDIPIGTVYTIHCEVPYESPTRYFFMSNQLVCLTRKKEVDFDPFIHIGALDIGSELNGKFTVQWVDMDIYDSYHAFTFSLTDNSVSIITYDFMNITVKYILEEILKICNPRAVKFLKDCINSLPK